MADSRAEHLSTEILRAKNGLLVGTSIADSAAVSIYCLDLQGRCIYINQSASQLLGWSTQECMGQDMHALVHHHHSDGRPYPVTECRIRDCVRTGQSVQVVDEVVWTKEAVPLAVDYSAAPLILDGETRGTVVSFTDITNRISIELKRRSTEVELHCEREKLATALEEQMRARQEIEAREDQFRMLADSMPQLAWMAHADGHIFWYNRRWYEYSATTMKDMEGWGWQSLHEPSVLPKVMERWKASISSGEQFEMTFPLRGADGKYRAHLTRVVPLRGADGTIVRWFGTNTDVERQLKAEAALRESEKLAAVGRLASSIAHEINNPLESITNLLYLARQSTELPEDVQRFLETADQELRRVSIIANQTLRFHKQATKPQEIGCADLFSTVLSIYEGRLRNSNISVEKRKHALKPVVCFEGEIRQVLNNVVSNAIDAMPMGGRLLVRSREATDWISRRLGLVLTVADTGSGIDPETQAKMFQAFFTTKELRGTGLGLWVSAEIIERHQGRIRIRSSQQQSHRGTVVTVFLPFETATSMPLAPSSTLSAQP